MLSSHILKHKINLYHKCAKILNLLVTRLKPNTNQKQILENDVFKIQVGRHFLI